jgi:hypothetical protein
MPKGSGLVYGGETPQDRTNIKIVPYQQLNRLFELTA